MDDNEIRFALCQIAWDHGKDEFARNGLLYRFVRPMKKRIADHVMVQYPEGGLEICTEFYNKYTREMRYQIGAERLLKSEIISRYTLRPSGLPVRVKKKNNNDSHASVVGVLRDMQRSSGSDEFTATRGELSSAAFCSQSSVDKALKRLSSAGVIAYKGGMDGLTIRILGVL